MSIPAPEAMLPASKVSIPDTKTAIPSFRGGIKTRLTPKMETSARRRPGLNKLTFRINKKSKSFKGQRNRRPLSATGRQEDQVAGPPAADNTPIHLPVKKWTLCWRCGYPGHLRGNCNLPPRLFCSRCGRCGIKSKDCPCPRQSPSVRHCEKALRHISQGTQCCFYPWSMKVRKVEKGTQYEHQPDDRPWEICEV